MGQSHLSIFPSSRPGGQELLLFTDITTSSQVGPELLWWLQGGSTNTSSHRSGGWSPERVSLGSVQGGPPLQVVQGRTAPLPFQLPGLQAVPGPVLGPHSQPHRAESFSLPSL